MGPGTRGRYSNGVEAVGQENGSHVIVSSSAAAAANARAAGRYTKQVGPKAAARAFNKYYSTRAYKSTRARKAAITRDLCKRGKNQTTTTSYTKGKTGVRRYDYPGMDDGSRCPQRGGYDDHDEMEGGYEEDEMEGGYEEDEMEQFGAGCRFDSVTGRCRSAPSQRMDARCEVGPRYMRKGKQVSGRCRKVAAKKSPKKARKSPKKARKSPKKTKKKKKKKKKKS